MADSSEIDIIAVMYPKPDTLDEFLGLIRDLVQNVRDTEPDVLLYYAVHAKDSEGNDEIVFVERYKNKEAFDAHIQGSLFRETMAHFPALWAKPPRSHKGRLVAGSASRPA